VNRRSLARIGAAGLLALVCLLSGCATIQSGIQTARGGPGQRLDPWENWNRKVFGFNEALDENVLKPVATVYSNVVPSMVRRGVQNFFNNFADAWSAVNNLLQGKVELGLQDMVRVGTNTLFGLGGVLDVASEMGIEHHYEDFGQTLGRWGFGAGAYVVWPLLGPSTVRETFAMPLDMSVSPSLVVDSGLGQGGFTALKLINTRAGLLGASRVIDDIALDKYSRRSLVFDGDPRPSRSRRTRPRRPPSQKIETRLNGGFTKAVNRQPAPHVMVPGLQPNTLFGSNSMELQVASGLRNERNAMLSTRLTSWFAAAALVAGCAVAQAQDIKAPDALIKEVSSDVIDAVKADKAIQAGDVQKVIALVDAKVLPYFNFQRMTAGAVGRYWRQATPEQQKGLQDEFKILLVRTYAGALAQVKDQTVQLKPMRAAAEDTEVVVRTEVRGKGDPIQLDYRLEKTPTTWKIYDVNVLGVWLVENYRNSFAQEISANGIDGLISKLAERNKAAKS
jgi:ABC-type transporter lipoprotein component MlaA/ABC-type transporter MlaC component